MVDGSVIRVAGNRPTLVANIRGAFYPDVPGRQERASALPTSRGEHGKFAVDISFQWAYCCSGQRKDCSPCKSLPSLKVGIMAFRYT